MKILIGHKIYFNAFLVTIIKKRLDTFIHYDTKIKN